MDSPTRSALLLDREKFPASFAGDLPIEQATFMADSQTPWGVDALSGSISEPAWHAAEGPARVARAWVND